jgi:hypothetical protein
MYSVAVSSTVIGAVAALAGVLLGQVLARSGEFRRWLRAERHKASAELLAAGEALRRHSADRVLDAYRGDAPAGDGSGTHLTDLERLGLALEAFRTVFPGRVAALAQEFSDAARALAHLGVTEPPGEQPGDRYITARNKITEMARRMIAPAWGDRLRQLSGTRRADPPPS